MPLSICYFEIFIPFQLKELGLESGSEDEEEDDSISEGEENGKDAEAAEEDIGEASVETLNGDEVESLRKEVEDSVVLWQKSRGIEFAHLMKWNRLWLSYLGMSKFSFKFLLYEFIVTLEIYVSFT